MIQNIHMTDLCRIAKEAGDRIVDVYDSEFSVETKADESPLTLADKKSHEVITRELANLYPEIPVLSEEGTHLSYEERKGWEYLWVVDPLDGTKEFVKRNGEFTVNIALVHEGKPVIGVIYAPILDKMYVAKKGSGAFLIEGFAGKTFADDAVLQQEAVTLPMQVERDKVAVVASRSHLSKETEDYIEAIKASHGEVDITSAGSSLKLCLVAEGNADVYPRFAPTMEWDTAAGQALVEQAGGIVVKTDESGPLVYNKEDLLNPWFLVKRNGF